MTAAANLNTRIRVEGGANVLAAAQADGVRRYLRESIGCWDGWCGRSTAGRECGLSNAKAKRELTFQPRPLEWVADTAPAGAIDK